MTEPGAAGRGELRKFGLLFGIVGAILLGLLGWKGSTLWWIPGLAGFLFAGSGLVAPSLLRPVYVSWMALARFLGWLNTRILLTLFFALVITPVGVVFRLFRKDFLEERMGTQATTYWKRRDEQITDKSRYENLF